MHVCKFILVGEIILVGESILVTSYFDINFKCVGMAAHHWALLKRIKSPRVFEMLLSHRSIDVNSLSSFQTTEQRCTSLVFCIKSAINECSVFGFWMQSASMLLSHRDILVTHPDEEISLTDILLTSTKIKCKMIL